MEEREEMECKRDLDDFKGFEPHKAESRLLEPQRPSVPGHDVDSDLFLVSFLVSLSLQSAMREPEHQFMSQISVENINGADICPAHARKRIRHTCGTVHPQRVPASRLLRRLIHCGSGPICAAPDTTHGR